MTVFPYELYFFLQHPLRRFVWRCSFHVRSSSSCSTLFLCLHQLVVGTSVLGISARKWSPSLFPSFRFPQRDSTSPASVWVSPTRPLTDFLSFFVSFTPSRSCPVISLFLLFPFFLFVFFALCLFVCVRSKPRSWTLQRGSITGRGTLTKSVNVRRGGSRSRSACYRYTERSQARLVTCDLPQLKDGCSALTTVYWTSIRLGMMVGRDFRIKD